LLCCHIEQIDIALVAMLFLPNAPEFFLRPRRNALGFLEALGQFIDHVPGRRQPSENATKKAQVASFDQFVPR